MLPVCVLFCTYLLTKAPDRTNLLPKKKKAGVYGALGPAVACSQPPTNLLTKAP